MAPSRRAPRSCPGTCRRSGCRSGTRTGSRTSAVKRPRDRSASPSRMQLRSLVEFSSRASARSYRLRRLCGPVCSSRLLFWLRLNRIPVLEAIRRRKDRPGPREAARVRVRDSPLLRLRREQAGRCVRVREQGEGNPAGSLSSLSCRLSPRALPAKSIDVHPTRGRADRALPSREPSAAARVPARASVCRLR